mgnify:CR=1 FL=1
MSNYGNPHEHVLHLKAFPGVGRVLIVTSVSPTLFFEVRASDPVWVYLNPCLSCGNPKGRKPPYWMRWGDIAEYGIQFETRKELGDE